MFRFRELTMKEKGWTSGAPSFRVTNDLTDLGVIREIGPQPLSFNRWEGEAPDGKRIYARSRQGLVAMLARHHRETEEAQR